MPYAVILNGVKNLKVSVAVNGSASLEILRCTQDDIKSERLPRSLYSLAMTPHHIGRDTLFSPPRHAIFRTRYFEIPFFMPIFVRFIQRPLY